MDRLIAFDAQDRRAEQLLGVRVDHDLDEAVGLAALAGSAHPGHGPLADEHPSPARARLGLVHADAAQGGIHEEAIDGDPIEHAAPLLFEDVALEEIARDDLVVVVGGVGEGAAPVALAERPHPGHAGLEPIVHLDRAIAAEAQASRVRAEIVGVRRAPHRDEEVAAHHLTARSAHRDPCFAVLDAAHLRIEDEADALELEEQLHLGADIGVFSRDEARRALDHRHLCAEAPVHLRELEADVAPTEDDQVRGHEVERHHGGAGEVEGGDL